MDHAVPHEKAAHSPGAAAGHDSVFGHPQASGTMRQRIIWLATIRAYKRAATVGISLDCDKVPAMMPKRPNTINALCGMG